MTVAAQNGRMRWWYDSIIDWMISNPEGKLYQCAAELKKAPSTISLVVNSDVFKARLAERRREFAQRHDHSIIEKTTRLAELSLDLQLEALDKKRDKVPLGTLMKISESSLAQLGYGVKSHGDPKGVTVNIGQGAGQTQLVSVSKDTLEEARGALRAAEQRRMIDITPEPVKEKESGAEPELEVVASDFAEVVDAPSGS